MGFLLPVILLLLHSFKTSYHQDWSILFNILWNTILISGLGAISIILISSSTAIISFYKGSKALNKFTDLASTGYAFPGTMLSIGVLVFAGFIDKSYISSMSLITDNSKFGLLSGTVIILLLAYVARFQAVGYGSIRSGLTQVPENLIDASYTMGKSFTETLTKIILPLIKTSIIAGGLLAFVDIMKELPMTLLLRPFNFETLATYTYQFAHDELIEQASLPALLIILAGLIPVIFMNKFLRDIKI